MFLCLTMKLIPMQANSNKFTAEQLERYNKIIQNDLRRRLRVENLVATKGLTNSIEGKHTDNSISIFMSGYAEYINEGTRGGKFPNLDNLIGWARAKNIRPKNAKGQFIKITPSSFSNMVYRIGRSIERKGIIKRFNGGSKFIDIVAKNITPKLTKDIAKAKLKDISNEIK